MSDEQKIDKRYPKLNLPLLLSIIIVTIITAIAVIFAIFSERKNILEPQTILRKEVRGSIINT